MTDGQTTEAYLSYKLTNEFGSGELKKETCFHIPLFPNAYLAVALGVYTVVVGAAGAVAGADLQTQDKETSNICFKYSWPQGIINHMSFVTRKPVFEVSDQSRLKLACSATETS